MKRQLLILASILISAILNAQVIHVPGDQPTIQAGIDAAVNGDVVLVDEGTWYENISFRGKAITVASLFWEDGDTSHISNTIIDGSQPVYPDSAACVMFVHGEDTTSILNGFTLTGGSGVWTTGFNVRSGGGVYAWEAGAKILNNKIMYNQVESDSGGGAGLVFLGGDAYWAVIDNNTISHNTSISDGFSAFGAGMSILVNAVIKNNIVEYNSCINTIGDADGGGIELELWELGSDQHAIVYNNIIRYNTLNANHYSIGGGICSYYVPCEIRNNEIYGNTSLAGDRCLGGGVRILFPETKVVIAYNEIYDNSLVANYGQGGGIDVGGAAGLVILSDNYVFNNEIVGTTAAWGAGMNFVQNNEMEVIGNNVHDNSISGGSWWCGAGIYHERANGSMEISNNIIRNNIGTGTSYGGAIGLYDVEGVSYSISSNFIQGNQSNYGGGLWTYNVFDVTLTNNIFVENNALSWGGAYGIRHNADDKPLNISIAYSLGEEIDFKPPKTDHHPVIINNTFFSNTAGVAGGVTYSDQQYYVPIFINDIFWQNTATYGNNIYLSSPDTIYISHCDIDPGANSIDGEFTGHGNIFEDPLFEPGDSLCCITGGPCHDEGIDELEIDGVIYFAPETDYDGTPRPQGDLWDIGAHECLMESVWMPGQDESFNLTVSPNPSSGAVHTRYLTSDFGYLIFEVYSTDGVMVKSQSLGYQQAGEHTIDLDLSDLPVGVYFIRLQVGKQAETAKVILIK